MFSYSVVKVVVFWIYLVDITAPAPVLLQRDTCADHLSFCQDFKGWGCGGQYEEWASYNCAKTCGYCDKKGFVIPHIPHTVTQPVPIQQSCVDEIPNCETYGREVCTDKLYETWAENNCASYCSLCGSNTCKDQLHNCADYGQAACGGQYINWAKDNCAKTCRLCDLVTD